MKSTYLLLLMSVFTAGPDANAQANKKDSALAAKTLHDLFRICRSVDFSDPNVAKLGTFYKAAPFIVYRGDDKNRAWKSMADYTKEYDKKGVDDICERINRTVNRDSAGYKITRYITAKESEGIWHVLKVVYKVTGVEKEAAFAFLKIGNTFGLGDID